MSGQEDGKHRADSRVGKQEHMNEKKKTVQTSATCGEKGDGALGVKSPLFHRTIGKTT